MCTDPIRPQSKDAASEPTSSEATHDVNAIFSRSPLRFRTDDIEQAYALDKLGLQAETPRSIEDLTFAQIPQQLWHFCSVDYGQKCTLCGCHAA